MTGLASSWRLRRSVQAGPNPGGTASATPRVIAWVAAGSALIVLVHLLGSSTLSPVQRLLGALPGIAAVAMVARYFHRRQFDRLPFLEYAAAQFYVFWGLPAATYQGAMRGTFVSEEAATSALVAINLTVAAALAAHPLGLQLGRRLAPAVERTLPREVPPNIGKLYLPWLVVAIGVHAGWIVSAVPVEYQNFVILVGSFVPIVVYAAMAARDGGLVARQRLWLTAGLLSLAGFFTGMMEQVILPILVAALINALQRRRLPVRLALVGAFLIVLINPTKHAYRQIAWSQSDSHVERDPATALANWAEAFERTWLEGDFTLGDSLDTVGNRLNELAYITPVFELCPGIVSHRLGADWAFIPLAVVPRAIYPDKPDYTEIFNARFNIAFGFQTELMTRTSTASFPLVADGYWNWGWPGVLLVGLLAGLALGVFGGAFGLRSWGALSLGALVFSELHAQGHLARLFIGVFQQYVATAIACWFVWLFGMGFLRRARAHGRPKGMVGTP